jgi:uncharacterized membrane protein YoaK (UPF0700 family)
VVRNRLIMALALSSGATDAICFLATGKFTAFMTGNLVFLGLRLGGAPAPAAHSILAPVAAFAIGVVFASRMIRPARGSETWPSRMTAALAVTALGHLCFFGLWFAVSGRPSIVAADVLLAVSGFAMGVQTAAVLALGIQGVFTTAATATLTVLMGNAARGSRLRDDRLLAGTLLALVVGATCGGALVVHARTYAPLLPLLTTCSVVVIAAIAFNDRRVRVGRYRSGEAST